MEKEHKNNIDKHMGRCIAETNFDLFFNDLIKEKMFNAHMQEEIRNIPEESRTEFLYNYIKTRGPGAYKTMVYSLYKTNHISLALLFGYKVHLPESIDDGAYGEDRVYKALERKDLKNPMKVYHMGSNPRGLVLIININEFVNNVHDAREGANLDVIKLQRVFEQLGYKIMLREDLSEAEFRQEIRTFARLEEHKYYDSSVVIVMTHGFEGKTVSTVDLCAYDGGKINSEDIVSEFYGYNAKLLADKPKLFFFQACRGKNMDHAMTPPPRRRTQTDGSIRASFPREISDILIVFPTAPGRVALREPDEGAWFIQELCKVLCDRACDTHLEDIIKESELILCIEKCLPKSNMIVFFDKKFGDMVVSKCCTGHKRHCHNHCPCPLDNQSRCGFNVYFAMCGKKKKKKLTKKQNIITNRTNTTRSVPKNGGISLSVTEINKRQGNSSDSVSEETNIEFRVKSGNSGNIKNTTREDKSSGQRNSLGKDVDFNLILSRLNKLEAKISNLENKSENRLSFRTRNVKSTVHLNRSKNGKQKRYTRETFDLGRNDKKTFHFKKGRSLDDDFKHRPSGSRGRLKKWQLNSRGVSPDGYETSVSVERTGKRKVQYSDSESTTSDEE